MSADPADNASSANAEKTLAERALRLLREDILAGRLAPDARLKVAALQARYGLGISPLREALLRLSSEGLVVAEGQRGFAVAAVSLAELEDLTRARICLETSILAEAIKHGDAEWEAGMVAAYHRLSRTPQPGDPRDREATALWEQRHRAFHDAISRHSDRNYAPFTNRNITSHDRIERQGSCLPPRAIR